LTGDESCKAFSSEQQPLFYAVVCSLALIDIASFQYPTFTDYLSLLGKLLSIHLERPNATLDNILSYLLLPNALNTQSMDGHTL
jgi:hypothetical protein